MLICFECDKPAEFNHHVVPRSKGGTRTVPLCAKCHGKIHNRKFLHTSQMTKEGLARKIANGEYTGGEFNRS